ncbi:MAG: GntR family transcriptional regulator [Planctomycetes bacterium]|nr:GntR family transcriptional regulator [Planctomycetota bacterium]
MLHYQIDPANSAPAYRQLMAQVQYYVASGAVKAGERLPSIRELARALRVNPSTIVKAYGELEHAGVIERRQGSGVFVRAGAKTPSKRERVRTLRERARSLVVEARQMGAERELVLDLLAEEWDALDARGARTGDGDGVES